MDVTSEWVRILQCCLRFLMVIYIPKYLENTELKIYILFGMIIEKILIHSYPDDSIFSFRALHDNYFDVLAHIDIQVSLY